MMMMMMVIMIMIIIYSALGPVWAGTRAQSGDRYDSGTLHSGQVLRGSLPFLSPDNDDIMIIITAATTA